MAAGNYDAVPLMTLDSSDPGFVEPYIGADDGLLHNDNVPGTTGTYKCANLHTRVITG